MSGEIEVDESYFLLRFVLQLLAKGAKRVRGKRGRGAGRKSFYFVTPLVPLREGMLKRNGCVYTLKHLLCERVITYYKGLCGA